MLFSLRTGAQVPSSGSVENYSAALGNGWWWLSDCNCRNAATPHRLWVLNRFPHPIILSYRLSGESWVMLRAPSPPSGNICQETSSRVPCRSRILETGSDRFCEDWRGRAQRFWLPVLWELGLSFFRVFFFLFSPQLFFCNNSVNMAAKGLISRLWCSGTTVQWVTIQ